MAGGMNDWSRVVIFEKSFLVRIVTAFEIKRVDVQRDVADVCTAEMIWIILLKSYVAQINTMP